MIKELSIGLAVILPIIYLLTFHTLALLTLVPIVGILILAYAIGDILLMEYYRWK